MYLKKSELSTKQIILSLFGFVILWAVVTDAWGYSSYLFPNDTSDSGRYLYAYASRCVWVLPVVLLLRRFGKKLTYNGRTFFAPPQINRSLLIVVCVSVADCIFVMFATHQGIWFNTDGSAHKTSATTVYSALLSQREHLLRTTR